MEETLAQRVDGAVRRAVALAGAEDVAGADAVRLRAAQEAVERLLGSEPRVELYALALDLERLSHEEHSRRLDERLAALGHLQLALSRLRAVATVADMLDMATKELCRACGFERALLFRLEGSTMTAASTYVRNDPGWAAELQATARTMPVRLDHLVLETEMIRRRGAVLVADPVNDPRSYKPLVHLFGTTSYVAAPIMPGGRVIGFLHGDLYGQERPVDELDRDTLWTFVEGFGYALERTILLQRLRGQRVRIEGLLASTAAIMTEVCDAERDLSEPAEGGPALPPPVAPAAAPEMMRRLLTPRELEVLELMAAGLTNVEIATRLVISGTTVKSHVKAILRKLRAANRAEAVARFLRAAQPM